MFLVFVAAFGVACGSKSADSGPNAKPADNADLCRELVAWANSMEEVARPMVALGENPSPADMKRVLPGVLDAMAKPVRDMEKRAPRDLQLELQDILKGIDASKALAEKAGYDPSKIDDAATEKAFGGGGAGLQAWRAKNCLR